MFRSWIETAKARSGSNSTTSISPSTGVSTGVHAPDTRAQPDRPVGELLEVHVGIPARVVADMLYGIEAPDVVDRSINLDVNLYVHGLRDPQ